MNAEYATFFELARQAFVAEFYEIMEKRDIYEPWSGGLRGVDLEKAYKVNSPTIKQESSYLD